MTTSGLVWRVLLGMLVLAGIWVTSLYSDILFHVIVEIFILVMCFSIFIVAWNTRNYTDNSYFTFLGIVYLFVGVVELFHGLTNDGLAFFNGYSSDLNLQLWIAARYLQSISFIIAIFFIYHRLRVRLTVSTYTVASVLILLSIFIWRIFPGCYKAGQGFTLFAIISQCLIAAIFLAAGFWLWVARKHFDRMVIIYLLLSVAFAVFAESVNAVNHLLYLASFFMIYRAIVVSGLLKPYEVLFRNLARSRDLLQKERDQLQNLLDIDESILVAVDKDEKITLVNRKTSEVFGAPENEMLGKPWFDTYLPSRVREKAKEGYRKMLAGQVQLVKYMERPVLTAGGEQRNMAWHNALIHDERGVAIGTFSSGHDITEQKRAEDLFKVMFNRSPVGMFITEKGNFRLVNPQFCKYAGYTENELIGRQSLSLVLPEDMGRVRQDAIRALKNSKDQFGTYDYRVKTRDGSIKWFMESVTSIHYGGRRATLGTVIDVSERKENEELFKSLSLMDDLTGLYNRRGFLTLAAKQLQLSYRMDRGVTILFADVDRLKTINDSFGHVEGDTALVATANLFKETFREADIVGRIMGDEFAVFMTGADDEYASTVISRLQSKLEAFNAVSGKPYKLSLSFGLASSAAGEPCNLGELLDTADRFMYKSKNENR